MQKGQDEVFAGKAKRYMFSSKTLDEEIDLDKDIVLPKLDLDTATVDEMRMFSQLLEQKAR